jgi:putative protease
MLKSRLSKLGGTPFYAEKIEIDCDDGLILPAAQINELRRRVIDKLSEADEISVCENPLVMPPHVNKSGVKYMTARFADAKSVPQNHPLKRVFIPIWSADEDFVNLHAGVEIPRALFGMEEKTRQRLLQLKKIGVNQALCGNLGSYQLASELGFEPFGDFGLNVFNSISANQINSPILSFELALDKANAVNAAETGIIVYGRLPLMLTRNCPVKSNIGCVKCGKKGRLTDRKGVEFPVRCSPYPCVEVLNSVPLYMADRMKEVKSDFAHFYFTDESLQQVEKIIALYQSGSKAPFNYTRGLYYRGVL